MAAKMTEADKDRRARRECARANDEIDRIRAKIAAMDPQLAYHDDDVMGELREARRAAEYWNVIVNNMNGYI